MIKKYAFTLAEILVCLIIIGILATVMLSAIRRGDIDSKTQTASLYKAIDVLEEASANIIANETTSLPTSTFITTVVGKPTFTTYKKDDSTKEAQIADIFDMYKTYIKFEKADGFCKYTQYCSDTTTLGGKLTGDIALGFQKYDSIKDCPAVYQPESNTKVTKKVYNKNTQNMDNAKCWGQVYIDVNGIKAPNTEGADVFIYGLDATGIAR